MTKHVTMKNVSIHVQTVLQNVEITHSVMLKIIVQIAHVHRVRREIHWLLASPEFANTMMIAPTMRLVIV